MKGDKQKMKRVSLDMLILGQLLYDQQIVGRDAILQVLPADRADKAAKILMSAKLIEFVPSDKNEITFTQEGATRYLKYIEGQNEIK